MSGFARKVERNRLKAQIKKDGMKKTQPLSKYRFKTQKELQIYNHCDNHKVDIDLMSFESGVAALLNLDTWMVTYFYDSAIDCN